MTAGELRGALLSTNVHVQNHSYFLSQECLKSSQNSIKFQDTSVTREV